VGDLKLRIHEAHGFPVADQKLINSGQERLSLYQCSINTQPCLGKVLPDDKTVEACEFREKDFLVLMVSKVINVFVV
jgi:UV excision repair protein RAD23